VANKEACCERAPAVSICALASLHITGILTNMRTARRLVAALMLAMSSNTFAGETTSILNTAWEAFWQQSGYPRAAYKWRTDIVMKFSGDDISRHKDSALKQFRNVAGEAGITILEAEGDGAAANVEVQIFGPNNPNPLPPNQPCETSIRWKNFVIVSARIRTNSNVIWRCMQHEAMHLMGVPGHPMYNSILSYFAPGGSLSSADKLLLATMYDKDMPSGASPFLILQNMARRLAAGNDNARQEADTFLRKTVHEMEEFGHGRGEAPTVIVRSGKATAQGLKQGQIDIQYFLGLAYLRGHIVGVDAEKAKYWLTRAAEASHVAAANLLKNAFPVP
jgi:hypothetical protein